MPLQAFPGVRFASNDLEKLVRQTATLFNNVLRGKLNIAVEFTPEIATTSTFVQDSRIGPDSIFLIEATSAAGATELASGSMFVAAANRGDQQCTISHGTGAGGELFRLVILS